MNSQKTIFTTVQLSQKHMWIVFMLFASSMIPVVPACFKRFTVDPELYYRQACIDFFTLSSSWCDCSDRSIWAWWLFESIDVDGDWRGMARNMAVPRAVIAANAGLAQIHGAAYDTALPLIGNPRMYRRWSIRNMLMMGENATLIDSWSNLITLRVEVTSTTDSGEVIPSLMLRLI